MPDFRMQQQFPMADVINAAQRKGQLDNETTFKQSEMLNNSIAAIGTIGESLYKRRMMMAQALAGAQMYASTPEGQAMLAPTSLADIHSSPVPLSQTAQGTDDAGNLLPTPIPNAVAGPATSAGVAPGAGPVASARQQTTKSVPSGVTPQLLATAMMGESPSNMLTQLFERQKQRQEFGLQKQKQSFAEKMEPAKLAQLADFNRAITGVKGREVSVQEQNNIRNQIATLEARQATAIGKFPELGGTFVRGLLPKGSNAQEEAAFQDYQDAKKQIEDYHRQLYSGGSSAGGPVSHMSTADIIALRNQMAPQSQ